MFYEDFCFTCDAAGVLHKETGERVDHRPVIIDLRERNEALEQEISRLKKNQIVEEHDPYKGMGQRHGGKHRMD